MKIGSFQVQEHVTQRHLAILLGIYIEALGMTLPHTATIPSCKQCPGIQAAKRTGMRIIELAKRRHTTLTYLDRASLRECHTGRHDSIWLYQLGVAFHCHSG